MFINVIYFEMVTGENQRLKTIFFPFHQQLMKISSLVLSSDYLRALKKVDLTFLFMSALGLCNGDCVPLHSVLYLISLLDSTRRVMMWFSLNHFCHMCQLIWWHWEPENFKIISLFSFINHRHTAICVYLNSFPLLLFCEYRGNGSN